MLSALKPDAGFLECAGQCSAVRTVSFRQFLEKVRGTAYRELLEYHLRRHPPREIREALREVLRVLPEGGSRVAAELAARWSDRLAEGDDLWERDCSDVAGEIAGEARELLLARGAPADEDVLFDLFEVVTLNYARAAHEHEAVRRAMGVRRHGWLARNGGYVAGAAACLTVAAMVDGLWLQALFGGAGGALLLPPAARWVRDELGGDTARRGG